MRVEQALRLLPDLEAVAPLRALLLASARPDERAVWASGGPYLTLGKRDVEPDELRHRMTQALEQFTAHVRALFEAYVDALDCQERGEPRAAVAALLRAGGLEEAVGRLAQARGWYEVALTLSEALQERRPEVETLEALGHLSLALGQHGLAGRHYQRALVLAEAEFDQATAITACLGLGNVALAQGQWDGAGAWYGRGLRMAEATGDTRRIGQLQNQLGALALKQGDLTAAGDQLRRARESFEALGEPKEMARLLNTQGQLDAQLGRQAAAIAAYREALAWIRRDLPAPALEASIRLNLAELSIEAERFLDAEEELRRTEQLAIDHNLTRRLVQAYTHFGELRGRQGDETGFVFFEQAIELCRALERSPAVEADVYRSYGLFRSRFGPREEARAYLERARDLFKSIGEAPAIERIQAELARLTA